MKIDQIIQDIHYNWEKRSCPSFNDLYIEDKLNILYKWIVDNEEELKIK